MPDPSDDGQAIHGARNLAWTSGAMGAAFVGLALYGVGNGLFALGACHLLVSLIVVLAPRDISADTLEQLLSGAIVITVAVATLVLPERLLPLVTIGFFASVLLGAGLQSRAHAVTWVVASGLAYGVALALRPVCGLVIPDFGVAATVLLYIVPPVFFWGYIDRQQQIAGEFRESIQQEMEERQRVEVAKARTEERSRAKDSFFATMSHELRTPLNAIIGYSEMLREDAEDAEDANSEALVEDLSKIENAGRHLVELIGDILDLSKIEAGKMEIEQARFDLDEVFEQLEATAHPLAVVNSNEIHFEKDPAEGLGWGVGDPMRLRQILLNLVSNACKFTKRGRVAVRLSRATDPEGQDWVEATVTDTGVGIEAEHLGRLFEPFTQADETVSRKYGGTGLGLALCARMSEMMGGTIEAESTPGQGSVFTVRLPV